MNKSNCQTSFKKGIRRQRNSQNGFTLVELIISLVIFMIVTGAIYGLLEVSRAGQTSTDQKVEAIQNVRNALNAIGRDALNAGFNYPVNGALLPRQTDPSMGLKALLGVNVPTDSSADYLTPVIVGHDVTNNNISRTGAITDQVTFAFQDVTFNGGRPLQIDSINNDGSILTIATGGNNSDCQAGDIFLISGKTNRSLGVVTAIQGTDQIIFGNGDTYSLNQVTSTSPYNFIAQNAGSQASLTRVNLVTYKVLPEGVLVRTNYGRGTNDGPQGTPLAFNVEDLVIKYVLDNGNVTDSPAPALYSRIRQIQITIIADSPKKGLPGAAGPNEPYVVTLSSTFNTRNISYANR